jgi:hypothetical protein
LALQRGKSAPPILGAIASPLVFLLVNVMLLIIGSFIERWPRC